ncbi:2-succinyl-5-enolpyruvyl-6-hydroxy-3-cyclohexene-1-carboxylic-acid synthase [Arthrobacter crusticola]|uniref:2-succinyl-5-enolpyruvyl-6-hydroxy-3-cyclohexene-1-carboxylate synthase n=1 Tax=Arthrobacter crusticola TaxID=2547960 RepID=A0A4R5TWL2_9MICC|nr:2-succinyl-5-enolpyruvyl-6-hydroxy-3-cyclohexene-1-carboxylic-acid synthase [Arthrobacter crusticola]TDK25541.1 2-succinyl-5-enolpyruvyl-6-hydroxy-3-cyclohexene-1-carboxylic-acid synthase [Arthrobacter crusticola]
MSDSLPSIEAARRAVAALAGGGVHDVVVAPGSRSAPLAYALAEAEAAGQLKLHVRIDERSAGFTALGLALGGKRPAAVLTTSGTAVGELLPAVMEANHAAVPLVVLSADRPEELRGTGANQTTQQPGLFGSHVRCALDVPAGEDPGPFVARAVREARGGGAPAGPVQLNLAFRDPLVPAGDAGAAPVEVPASGHDDGATLASARRDGAAAGSAEALRAGGRRAPSAPAAGGPVVVAGHGAGELAAVFAAHLGLPLLAEPSSNARFGISAIAPYRLLLGHLGAGITRVVVFGRPTLSRPVAALLARTDIERALYLPEPAAWFEPGRRPERIIGNLPELLEFTGPAAPGWLEAWRSAGAAADAAIATLLAGEEGPTGPAVAEAVWEQTDGFLVLGSSNPIRDVDLTAAPGWHPLEVFANRGLAGIDGTVSTATGIALATGVPTRVLLGDLTFLHDAGGLLIGAGETEPDLQLVVLNDHGGGIFGLLEHGEPATMERYGPAVERLFGTPQQVDLAALAAAYGVDFERVTTLQGLETAMERPLRGRSIVEVQADRQSLRALHSRIQDAVAAVLAP